MTDDYAIEGAEGAYVPCDDAPAVLVVEEEGAIWGMASGYVEPDSAAAALPTQERAAIVGSAVGFVAKPCEECEPAGTAQGVFRAFRRYTPKVYHVPDPPIGPTIESTGGTIAAYGVAADGRGREGTIQYTIPGGLTGLHMTIVIRMELSATVNNAVHQRCYTNIPFDWELRRAGWGASFTPTYDDLQLDAVGSLLTAGTFTPAVTLCDPYLPGGDPPLVFPILTYEDDFTKDGDGKIQLQFRVSDLNVAAAAQYNNFNYGSGFFVPGNEAEWDDYLYSHSVFRTTITVCALS